MQGEHPRAIKKLDRISAGSFDEQGFSKAGLVL